MCLATHYYDKLCQKKDKGVHRKRCTYWLHRDIDAKCQALLELKSQGNCSASDVAAKEHELARLYVLVGELLRMTKLTRTTSWLKSTTSGR